MTQKFSFNWLNSIKYLFYGSELVGIDTLFALFQKFLLSRQNFEFSVNAVLHITGSNQPILLILNSKHRTTLEHIVFKFEENRTKIATLRVPHRKKYKVAAMTSSHLKFQKLRKKSLANICQIIYGKFHQNWFICLGCRDDTHAHTDRHTHTCDSASFMTSVAKVANGSEKF